MADPAATPVERGRRAWAAMLDSLPAATLNSLPAESLGDGSAPDDPRCTAVASFVIAICDGLSVQWLLDPEGAPASAALSEGLAAMWTASLPGPR